jgi:hypothetical protein
MLNKFRNIATLLLVAIIAAASFAPATNVSAEGSGWGEFIDSDGNPLPGVIIQGETTIPAPWMPSIPGLPPMEATYHVLVAPSGETVLMPSATTLFFMAMNPAASGIIDADHSIESLPAGAIMLGGQIGSGNGATFLSNLFQSLTGMTQVDADQFADAAIAGDGSIWSMFNPLTGSVDLFNIMMMLADASWTDGNLYTIALLYETCMTSPTGCPDELCLVNPVACGLPTPEATEINPEPTPTEPPTCPGPSVTQAWPTLTINPTAPNYPVVVGQDPDQRGVDVEGSVTIPPVIYTWYEPVYEDVVECRLAGSGVSDCTRPSGRPGYLRTVPSLTDCIMHQEELPERITMLNARATLTETSRNWIVNGLGANWYGAHVKQGAVNLNQHGQVSMGCAGATCSGSLSALGVPFADPGNWDLTITVGTAGTYHNGVMITTPRVLNGRGTLGVYVILPALIDANP